MQIGNLVVPNAMAVEPHCADFKCVFSESLDKIFLRLV